MAGEFTDSVFSAQSRSLFYITGHRPTTYSVANWKRPHELMPSISRVNVGLGGVLTQGWLKDAYLLSAIAMAREKNLVGVRIEENGAVRCRVWKNNEWKEIVVDSKLPCLPGMIPQVAYASPGSENDWGLPFVEKAYAKLHGSYQMIEGGSVTEALVDLTGGVAEAHVFRGNDETGHPAATPLAEIWPRIDAGWKDGFLLGGAILGSAERTGTVDAASGLLINHVYPVIDVRVVGGGRRMLKMRNPWPKGDWKGPWGEGAREWLQDARIADELGYSARSGTFWMDFDDWINVFSKLYICRPFQNPKSLARRWTHTQIQSAWEGLEAGGSLDYPTWRSNPQWLVQNPSNSPAEVVIVVSQADGRLAGKPTYDHTIGCYVFKTLRGDSKKLTYKETDKIAEAPFVKARDVTISVVVEPRGMVIVMPSALVPETHIAFGLDVYSTENVSVKELPEPFKQQLDGEWKGPSAGGCPNYPTWVRNPQFFLMPIRPQAAFTIVLRQEIEKTKVRGASQPPINAIGFQVCKASENNRITLLQGDSVVGQSDYVEEEGVAAVVHVKDPHKFPFVIVPSSYYPAKHAKFTLTIYCDTAFVCQAAPEGSAFEGLDFVLDARARGDFAAVLDPSELAQTSSQNSTRAYSEEDIPAKFIRKRDNPLYATSNSTYGNRPMAAHERPNKVFYVSQRFSKAHGMNYRGHGMN